MLKYYQDLKKQLKEVDKKQKEWQKCAEDSSTFLSWLDANIQTTKEVEIEVDKTGKDTKFSQGGWFRRSDSSSSLFISVEGRVKEAVRLAESAESSLDRWQTSKGYLERLILRHLIDHRCQKWYLEACREDMSKRKAILIRSLVRFEQLNALSRNDYIREAEKCRDALTRCENGIKKCNTRIQTVKEEKRKVKRGYDKVLKEEEKCKSKVMTCISELEEQCNKLQREINERVEEINSDGYLAKATAERFKEKSTVKADRIRIPLRLGALSLFRIGVAIAEGPTGVIAYNEVKEERDRELYKLRNHQDELKKCDQIIRRCKEAQNSTEEVTRMPILQRFIGTRNEQKEIAKAQNR